MYWIRMPFGVVSGIGRGMGVLDGSGDRRREGAVLGVNLWRPIVTKLLSGGLVGNDVIHKTGST